MALARISNDTASEAAETLFSSVDDPAEEPLHSEPWLRLWPAGEAFLTTNDLPAAAAHQLLHQAMDSATPGKLMRPAVAALRFLRDVPGGWCTTAEYTVFCAAVGREGPWARSLQDLAAHRRSGMSDEAMLREQIWEHPNTAGTRRRLSDALRSVLEGDGPVGPRLDSVRGDLVPGVKATAWPALRTRLTEAFGRGSEAFAAAAKEIVCTRIAESLLDMNRAYLSMLEQAELLERRGTGTGTEWRITSFGEEAYAACPTKPPSSVGAAWSVLRNSVEFGYEQRARTRREKLGTLIERLRNGEGSDLLAALEWGRHRGQGEAGRYEWAAVLATLAAVDLDDTWDPFDPIAGLRTKLSYDLEPLGPAAGRGADAYITTQDGLTILVEVTGVEGDQQISQELEPTTRHLREHLAGGKEAVVLFVAPEVSERFVAQWLGAAMFEDPDRPAMVVPLTERQLREIAESRADLVGVCRRVVEETVRISEAAMDEHRLAWAAPAARQLLEVIQGIVTDAVAAT